MQLSILDKNVYASAYGTPNVKNSEAEVATNIESSSKGDSDIDIFQDPQNELEKPNFEATSEATVERSEPDKFNEDLLNDGMTCDGDCDTTIFAWPEPFYMCLILR